ncbi:hypothetical protein DESME_08015 [Desulfitobacterium metallireducens DSM 15288]|uniref:Uncharacterized protein n=1 Tax=Desulfitobacterium metallireducens DSM 15288 TaxID=871968 RepID=W0EHI7_9FIRM|nr:hypothetical protein DESME_08015 [Desulfitobacterium metallireducens DSM 15288]
MEFFLGVIIVAFIIFFVIAKFMKKGEDATKVIKERSFLIRSRISF